MYMGAGGLTLYGGGTGLPGDNSAQVDPLTGRTTTMRSTGTYFQCPAGQVVMKTIRGKFGAPDQYVCGYPAPAPAPAPMALPAPAPAPVYTTTISPSFQQQFTPQVSPVIQTQVDSPNASQGGATEQVAQTPQSATAGGTGSPQGITAEDLAAILAQQAADRAAEQEAQRRADAQARAAEQEAQRRADAQARADALEAQRQYETARLRAQQESEAARAAEREAQQRAYEAQYQSYLQANASGTPSAPTMTWGGGGMSMPGPIESQSEPGALISPSPWPKIAIVTILAGSGIYLLKNIQKFKRR